MTRIRRSIRIASVSAIVAALALAAACASSADAPNPSPHAAATTRALVSAKAPAVAIRQGSGDSASASPDDLTEPDLPGSPTSRLSPPAAPGNPPAASVEQPRPSDLRLPTSSTQAIAALTPNIGIPANETIVGIHTPTRTPTRTATPTRTLTPAPTHTPQPGGGPTIGGCNVFPSNNPWNANISAYPVHPNSQNFINNILAGSGTDKLHPDFGSNPEYGIPYIVVPQSQPLVPINFTDYGDESDPGPYPIPLNSPIEGGGDRHVLAVQQGTCKLFEMFVAVPQADRWDAASGAVFDLSSNALRPLGWTSADAAGLPILPGLVRYDEVQAGAIRHALRFTVQSSQRAYILPATHWASSSTDPNRPPMGLRLRLKATYDISGYSGQTRVVLEALRTYGMIVADNGSNWFISGARDPSWDDENLNQLKNVPGSAFEVVNTGPVVTP